MIRLLDGLALLKEVDEIDGIEYTSQQLKKMRSDQIVVIRHTSYIYRDALCEAARMGVTNLDDYVPLGELVDHLSIHKNLIRERIDFMRKTGSKLFDHMMVSGIQFIRLDNELKYLLQNYQPFLATLGDAECITHCKLLGDLKIGFY